MYFYTDSEELTAQYNHLGVAAFRTLPIPHTHQPVERDSSQRPLSTCRIIQDLWNSVETGKLECALQSNYNVADGESQAVIARCELEHFPSGPVRLFKEPLSSVDYQGLLLSGDIHLLLYDAANDYARSSGILVERGLPVLVPAGTWRARQFLDEYYQHYVDQLDQRRRSVVPLLPRLIEVERKSRKAVSLLTLAPGAVRLWVAFGAPYVNCQVSISEITIDFLSTPQNTQSRPTGAVGLIYHDPVEIPVLLRELIDEYPHYRRTARAFAGPWTLCHNASRLVKELEVAARRSPEGRELPPVNLRTPSGEASVGVGMPA